MKRISRIFRIFRMALIKSYNLSPTLAWENMKMSESGFSG
jgi:hypothetical protein